MCWAYRRKNSNMALEAVVWIIIIMFGAVTPYVSSIEAVSGVPNCHQSERQALLNFKHHLTDPFDRLSSWVAGGISCCGWHGVVCENLTGHVVELHLRNPFSNDDFLKCRDDQFYGSDQTCEPPFLGGNYLKGKIPGNMDNMSALESLDLSMNRLSGEIPQSMASMTFMSFLNVSFNDLVGRIPTGTQIQGFNASSFMGNQLCGPPVSANCGPDEPAPSKQQEDDNQHHDLEDDEPYVSICLGYVVGLGAVIAPLLYSTAWRHHYFQWVHSVWDRLWVWTVLFRTRVVEVA